MRQDLAFGSWSLTAAALAVLLATPVNPTLAYMALRAGDTAAWLAVLFATLLALLLLWPVAAHLGGLPGGNLIDLARLAAGKAGAVITGILVAGFLVYYSGFVIRQTAEMVVTSTFPHTPQTLPTAAITLAALYGALSGIASIVRLCRILLPLFLLGILLILVGAFAWGEFGYLFPLWGPGPARLLINSMPLSALYTPPILFLLMAAGKLHGRPQLWRSGAVAIASAGLLFAGAVTILLMTHPLPLGYSVTFPLHKMARILMGGRFFERMDGIWIFFWFFAIACHLSALLHTAAAAYAEAFGIDSHRPAVLPLVTLTLMLSLFPRDQGEAIRWQVLATPIALGIGFGLPLALTLVAAGRRRWGGRAV